jgi:hypothetical protein
MCGFASSCPGLHPPFAAVDSCTRDVLTSLASQTPDAPLFQSLGANALLACAAKATDCADWLECAAAPYGPSYCASHVGASCDGLVAVDCASASAGGVSQTCPSTYPCSVVDGGAICTDGTACVPQAFGQCVGNYFVTCPSTGTGLVARRCAPGACGETGTPPGPSVPGCIPNPLAPSCSTTTLRCDGNFSDECQPGHPEQRFDCAIAAAQCDLAATDAYFAYCVPIATQCNDQVDTPSCEGNALRWCIDGEWRTFDCTPIGMRCDDRFGDPGNCVP